MGLAPAAHGGNRTGRIFTGDRSGDWLFAGLFRAGLAVQPTSTHAGDGQALVDTRLVAAVRCAPPDNRPSVEERDRCAPYLEREVPWSPARSASWWRWAATAGTPRCGRCARSAGRCPAAAPLRARCRGPAARARPRRGAARQLPPQPAEHLHGAADRADARRRPRPGGGPAGVRRGELRYSPGDPPRHHRPRPRPPRHHRRDHGAAVRSRPQPRGLLDDAAARSLRDDAHLRGRPPATPRSSRPWPR